MIHSLLRSLIPCFTFALIASATTEHPRMFRDPAVHPTGASWIAAQRAKANTDPLPAMLRANERALWYANYPARPSTLAALYLYQWQGVDGSKTAEDWAVLARMKTLALIANTDRWANNNFRSLSRGIDTLHVGVAYDILYTSQDWQDHVVQASDLGITYYNDVPYAITLPEQYVGLPMNEAVSLALRTNADSLIASGGAGWPGNTKIGNNWFAVRYAGALFGYMVSDHTHEPGRWNDAIIKLSSHLDATLTRSPLAQGWNPEAHNYMWFPGWHTLPTALALKNLRGVDLTQTWPALKLTAWAATYATGPVPIPKVLNTTQTKAFGIHPDLTDDNNRWNPEGNAGLAFAFAPESHIPGMKWIYRRMTGDLGDDNWDAESGSGIYSMLFWPDVEEANPALGWGKIYYDPLYGLVSFRNGWGNGPDNQIGDTDDFHAMDQDISVTMSANMRSAEGGHGGPDTQNLRIIGMGDIWATGQGRNNDVSASSTIFADDPETILRGASRFGTRVVDSYLRQPTGDGYIIMTADIGDGGVTDFYRRLIVDFSGKSGTPAVLVVSDSTTTRSPWWRMNTFVGHTIDVSTPGQFIITSPDGDRLLGVAMVSGDAPQMRTGTRRRGSALQFNGASYSDNRWVDFQAGVDGEIVVAMSLVPAGDPLPQIDIVRESDGTANVTVTNPGHPGIRYAVNGNDITVDGWNPPDLLVAAPIPNQSLVQSLGQHQNFPVSGYTSDSEGGIVETIDVYLNGELMQTLPINSASSNWGPVALPTLDIGNHTLLAVAKDNDNEEKRVEVNFRVTATQPPHVAITSPSRGNRIWAGQNMVIRGHAFDPENRLARVEVWEKRYVDKFAGTGPHWRRLGNAILAANATWAYTVPQIPSGTYEYMAIAIDQDGDFTETDILPILSSFIIGSDPIYGDVGNFMKNFGAGVSTSIWGMEWIDGSMAIRAQRGEHPQKQAFFLGTGSSASFQLRFRAKAEDMPTNASESYEVAFGESNFVDMQPFNSIQHVSGGDLPSGGTRVYDGSSQFNTGMLATFNWYGNKTPGYPDNPHNDYAGIPNFDWNDVVITRLGSRMIVDVNGRTIIDGVHPRVRTQGMLGLGFKRDKDGRFFFKDIELDWLDANGNPIIDSVPDVTWSNPQQNSNLPVGIAVQLSGTVSDADGIAMVELIAGSTLLEQLELNGDQWSYAWDSPAIGEYSFTLRVTDAQDRVTWSEPLLLSVTHTGGPAGNLPPSVTIGENGAVLSPNFGLMGSVVDPENSIAVVQIFTAGEIVGTATISGTNWNYTVSNLPTGTYEFTALAIDERGATATASFTASVDGNVPPTITAIANQSIDQNSQTAVLAFTIGDDETPVDELQLLVASSNPVLLPLSGIALDGSGANRTLQLTPATDQSGTSVITLTVTDGGGKSSSNLFTLNVLAPPVPSAIIVEPLYTEVAPAETVTFSAVLVDQFGAAINPQPAFSWSVAGGGTIFSSGIFTAGPMTGGPFTITVSGGGLQGSAQVAVVANLTATKTVVHWGGDYVTSNQGTLTRGTWATGTLLELGGGNGNDAFREYPFDLDAPFSAGTGYNLDGRSGRFYGGVSLRAFNATSPANWADAFFRNGATDDFFGFRYQRTGGGAVSTVYVWLKSDFLNGADTSEQKVTLNSASSFRITHGGAWDDVRARWVVREGDQWYVSQTEIPSGRTHKSIDFATGNGFWAAVDFATTPHLNLDLDELNYEAQLFSDLTAFGVYTENDNLGGSRYWTYVREFVVEAAVSSAYNDWLVQHWGSNAFSAEASEGYDADWDGLSNLMEYALGGNPVIPDTASVAPLLAHNELHGEWHLQLSFLRLRRELEYRVEATDDLLNWYTIAVNPGEVGEVVTVTDTTPTTSGSRFLRLAVDK